MPLYATFATSIQLFKKVDKTFKDSDNCDIIYIYYVTYI